MSKVWTKAICRELGCTQGFGHAEGTKKVLSKQVKTQWHDTCNSWTTCQHILMPRFDTMLQTWSSMSILMLHTSVPKNAWSRKIGIFFLSIIPQYGKPKLNGTIHILCTTLKFCCIIRCRSRIGGIISQSKKAQVMWLTLVELGHPYQSTSISQFCIVNYTMKIAKIPKDRSALLLAAW